MKKKCGGKGTHWQEQAEKLDDHTLKTALEVQRKHHPDQFASAPQRAYNRAVRREVRKRGLGT